MKVSDILEEYKELPSHENLEVLTLTEKNGFVPQADRFHKRLATQDTSKYRVVNTGDFAYNPYLLWAGAIAVNERPDPGIISPVYPTFRLKEGFDPGYIFALLLSPLMLKRYDTISYGSVPRRRRAATKDFLNLTVPDIPPLEEQQRIATILGTVEEARTKQDALISELSSLEIAVCDAIFSAATEQIRLEEIADLQGGLTLNKRRKDNPIEVNYLRVGNVQRRSLELSTVKTIRCKENEIQRCELRKGDVLLVEANANPYEVGRAAQVPEFDTPTVYQNHLFRARPKNDVHPDYLEQAINSMPVRRQLVALARTTSGLNGFSISQARSLKIPLLSQQMQAELADRVSGFRQARVLQEEKAHRLNELYVSLSSHAFAGEL
ncbi:restriction endonuclease subunit S [Corynebacterium sp. CCUG 51687]|uniref:restriction endonuclease subunit S n=1 Tax=Corynebacterium sp. CCUG 51687 TaxID=2823897 RepID=UPI00210B44A2|nr:restriction endonuclease subunit S [Corynebacterium sp. CCUG 51687]MCQ4612465.1 restriction endonuclease subunit S [Corynebacterium sp. CCUG 51687]